jgi:tetratricopeptide (TPR) repeat protein
MRLPLFIIVSVLTTTVLVGVGILLNDDTVVKQADYERYIEYPAVSENMTAVDLETDFWNKRLQKTADDVVARAKIAGLLAKRFSYSGNIKEVIQADSLYQLVNQVNRINSSGTYRSLAATCITRHQFRLAKLYIDSALRLGDDKYQTLLMQFDVDMELGNYMSAKKILQQLSNKTSFEYLIRMAKYTDHAEGNLDKAIVLMEQAFQKIKDGANKELFCWAKSNLGDMYGHANRFKDAYRCYLEVLSADKEYYHCLKGIAWLAFSHDKNIGEAKKIISYLKKQHPVPDYDLLLAEIASFENNTAEMQHYISIYTKAIKNYLYGDMYNKYNFNLAADDPKKLEEAFLIAQTEITNRPTPESYHLLAWATFKKGNITEAIRIADRYVTNRCFEPEVLYHLGMIYKAGGQAKKGRNMLRMAGESWFELGPVATNEVNKALKNG